MSENEAFSITSTLLVAACGCTFVSAFTLSWTRWLAFSRHATEVFLYRQCGLRRVQLLAVVALLPQAATLGLLLAAAVAASAAASLGATLLLGAALARRPALLVLDEPCQGLDLANRLQWHYLARSHSCRPRNDCKPCCRQKRSRRRRRRSARAEAAAALRWPQRLSF